MIAGRSGQQPRTARVWPEVVFSLRDKVALVTGAASGIGAATAKAFAQAGADLTLCWTRSDPHSIAPTVAAVEATGRRAVEVEGDVTSSTDVDGAIRKAIDTFGGLDVVVANAAIARDCASHELTDGEWARVLDVNLGGVLRCFRAALPHMIEVGRGRLLATGSVVGPVQGWARHAHYTASKAGVVGLTRSLALEVAQHGITANVVAPGVAATPQTLDPVHSLGPEGLREYAGGVPMGRNATVEDVAHAFVFLASDEAAFITGQLLIVDGGASLSQTPRATE